MSSSRLGIILLIVSLPCTAWAAGPTSEPSVEGTAMQAPQYPVSYVTPTVDQVKSVMDHVRHVADIRARIPGEAAADADTGAHEPHWGLISYPMGVLYSGMLSATDATGDKAFSDFVVARFSYFAAQLAKGDPASPAAKKGALKSLLAPGSLDACGAMGTSILTARAMKLGPDLKPIIDIDADFVSHGQFRLDDGTFARKRPFPDSIWADDAYMGTAFLTQMAVESGDKKYFDDSAKQLIQIYARLYTPSSGLCTHGWHAGNSDNQPRYYWGRANGWLLVALANLLSNLPEDHPARADLLKLFREHAQGVASVQSGSGLWHQMLDRPDSFLETSCTSMFTYAMARGINRGWIDGATYGPVVQAGWAGVCSKIDADGHITDTCIGTNYADDYVYYYARPHIDDIHGYGATLLAGSEFIRLLKNDKFKIENTERNAVMYVPKN